MILHLTKLLITICVFVFPFRAYAQNYWEQTNGPYAGSVLTSAIDSRGNIYIGTDISGLYRTTDMGNKWIKIGLEFGNKKMYSIASSPSGSIFVCNDRRVYRSPDQGNTWSLVLPNQSYNESIGVVAADDNGIIYAGSNSLYRSTNDGLTWWTVETGVNHPSMYSAIAFHSGGYIIAGGFGGVVWSNDNGKIWQRSMIDTVKKINVQILCVHPSGEVFAGTVNNGIFRSTDRGTYWQKLTEGIPDSATILSLVVTKDEEIFAGTDFLTNPSGIYRSIDSGNHWTLINNGMPKNINVYSLISDQSQSLYASTTILGDKGGFFKSTNNGENWSQLTEGIKNFASGIIELAIDKSGWIYAVSFPYGIFQSVNNGQSWTMLSLCGNHPSTDFYFGLTINSNDHIVTSLNGDVYRSTDEGNIWSLLNSRVSTSFIFNYSDDLLIGSSDTIYKSIDNGLTFTKHSVPWEGPYSYLFANHPNGDVYAVARKMLPDLGYWVGSVLQTSDRGENWQLRKDNIRDFINDLMIDWMGRLFIGTKYGGVLLSEDNGKSWTPINTGLSELAVNALISNSLNHVFAGNGYSGVTRLKDIGGKWESVNNGLVMPDRFLSFALNKDEQLFVGSDHSGVYRSIMSTLSTPSDKSLNQSIPVLIQIYPNPFRKSTTIRFSIPVETLSEGSLGHVTSLHVFDFLGREVKTLFDGEIEVGEHTVQFNADQLPNGVYQVVLQSGKDVSRKNIVVMR